MCTSRLRTTIYLASTLLALLPCNETLIAQTNLLRPELQRPIDSRLIALETKGIEKCGLFTGKVHRVQSPGEIRGLSGKLNPGDQLVLVGANWENSRFTFAGEGTQAAPILVRAERPDSVVFSGVSAATFHGRHLIVMDLTFKDVVVKEKGTVIFRLGDGVKRPAEHCIVNRVRLQSCNSANQADWPNHRMWYMTVQGRSNTVANSTFAQLRNFGQMLAAQELPRDGLLSLHILNNRFIDRLKLDDQNGYEIIQIGWSGEKARSAGALIQGNIFENCDGENETITLKASDIFVRTNLFTGCQGVLCIREGDRVLVQANTFDGKGKSGTGGVRLQGADHVIERNTFRDIKDPPNYYCWPISIMAASSEKSGDDDGYARGRNIVIANNRFERTERRIAVGIYPRPEYPLLPRDIFIKGNVFVGGTGTNACDFIAPDPAGTSVRSILEAGNVYLPDE